MIEKQVSYIIGYRQSSADRLTGLRFVLAWLNHWLPDIEIILVEQDSKSVPDIITPPNCKKYFIPNPGLYNRCWAFNVGAAKASGNILVFADSDMFMSKEDYLKSFEACTRYEVVNPNGNRVVNVTDADWEKLKFKKGENRRLWTFAAGIILMSRHAFSKINGWDERFEGWGLEDDAISHIVKNTFSNIILDCRMFHVDHARSSFDGKTQPNYLFNRKIFEELSVLYGPSLSHYLDARSQCLIGDEQKYTVSEQAIIDKYPRFVLLVIANQSLDDLKAFLESWKETRFEKAEWVLLISHDGLSESITEYLSAFSDTGTLIQILDHSGEGHLYRFNAALEKLKLYSFDVCFYSSIYIRFLKPGWDLSYYTVIERTGLGHLCYYNQSDPPLSDCLSITKGDLSGYDDPMKIQSHFFTIIPEMIDAVGYMDSNIMYDGRLEFLDYSLRCCRLGFNVLKSPFDLKGSNEMIHVVSDRSPFQDTTYVSLTNCKESEYKKKVLLLSEMRMYIPMNNLKAFTLSEKEWSAALIPNEEKITISGSEDVRLKKELVLSIKDIAWLAVPGNYQKADSRIGRTVNPKKIGIGLIKKIYNLIYSLRLYAFIQIMDHVASFFIKLGLFIKNIDNKRVAKGK